ncbi:hypothetical protein [Peterkaempfera sp. SMS 1(5)a]|uniref:hypothetical protein n=1 Tax=Peterkaempfera podocarpi TaxID=3232308 RepID=UPI00366A800A
MDLIIRCEGFEQKYGGLHYDVRHNLVVNGERYASSRQWEYNHFGLSTRAWQDTRGGGWYFEWAGEHVSKPCRDLIHTDQSVGTDVDGGRPYLRLAPSVPHVIESHALTDTVATWTPWPIDTLATMAAGLIDGLADVSEASWGTSRWQLSQTVAVLEVDGWDSDNPRRRTRIWSRDETGHRDVRVALEHARQALDQGEAAAVSRDDTTS